MLSMCDLTNFGVRMKICVDKTDGDGVSCTNACTALRRPHFPKGEPQRDNHHNHTKRGTHEGGPSASGVPFWTKVCKTQIACCREYEGESGG